jgi:ribosome maturation factor RimP
MKGARDRDGWMGVGDDLLAALGLYVVDLEIEVSRARPLIRYFVDSVEGPPVTIEQCARANRALQGYFDEHLPFGEEYAMEVSSPGIERRVARPRDYQRFLGRQIQIRLRENEEGRRNLLGVLVNAGADGFRLAVGDTEMYLEYNRVSRANLTWDYSSEGR